MGEWWLEPLRKIPFEAYGKYFGRNRPTEMVLFIRKGKVLSICASEKILLLYYYYFY